MEYIAQFTNEIIYVNGKDNVVADMLSRLPEIDSLTHNVISFQSLKKEQENEISSGLLNAKFKEKYNIKEIQLPDHNFKILCEITGNKPDLIFQNV